MSDLIDRQAVLDAITSDNFQRDFPRLGKTLEVIIRALPSVTPTEMKSYIDNCGNIFTYPTERTGHWLYKHGELFPNIKCSKCGYEPYFSSKEPLYKFCPNCGADMTGGMNL